MGVSEKLAAETDVFSTDGLGDFELEVLASTEVSGKKNKLAILILLL